MSTASQFGTRGSLAIFMVRTIVGLGFIFHSMFKLPTPTMWMGPQGFAPPWLQGIVTFVELFGGIALIVGFLTPVAAFLLAIDMIVAIFKYHIPAGGHFVGGRASFEVPLVYLVVVLALLIAGPGRFSIDGFIGRRRS